eukprot:Rmarinus@m.1344
MDHPQKVDQLFQAYNCFLKDDLSSENETYLESVAECSTTTNTKEVVAQKELLATQLPFHARRSSPLLRLLPLLPTSGPHQVAIPSLLREQSSLPSHLVHEGKGVALIVGVGKHLYAVRIRRRPCNETEIEISSAAVKNKASPLHMVSCGIRPETGTAQITQRGAVTLSLADVRAPCSNHNDYTSQEDECVRSKISCCTMHGALPDDKIVVVGHTDGRLSVWTLGASRWRLGTQVPSYDASLEPTWTHLGHTGAVTCVALHSLPKKKESASRLGAEVLLASAAVDKTIRTWDARTGQPLRTLVAHPKPVVALLFHPKKRELLSLCSAAIRVWDVRSGVLRKASKRSNVLLAVDPASGTVVVSSMLEEGQAEKDARTLSGRPLLTILKFSCDGSVILGGYQSGIVRVWNARTLRLRYEFHLPGSVTFVDVLNKDRVLAACNDGVHGSLFWYSLSRKSITKETSIPGDFRQLHSVFLLDPTPPTVETTPSVFSGPVASALFIEDEGSIAPAFFRGVALMCVSPSRKEVCVLDVLPNEILHSFPVWAPQHCGHLSIVGEESGGIALLDSTVGHGLRIANTRGCLKVVVWSVDDQFVVTATEDCTVFLWDMVALLDVVGADLCADYFPASVKTSGTGIPVETSSSVSGTDADLEGPLLWEVPAELASYLPSARRLLLLGPSPVVAVAFSPPGSGFVALATADGCLTGFTTDRCKLLWTVRPSLPITSGVHLALHSSGRFLAVRSQKNGRAVLRVVSTDTGCDLDTLPVVDGNMYPVWNPSEDAPITWVDDFVTQAGRCVAVASSDVSIPRQVVRLLGWLAPGETVLAVLPVACYVRTGDVVVVGVDNVLYRINSEIGSGDHHRLPVVVAIPASLALTTEAGMLRSKADVARDLYQHWKNSGIDGHGRVLFLSTRFPFLTIAALLDLSSLLTMERSGQFSASLQTDKPDMCNISLPGREVGASTLGLIRIREGNGSTIQVGGRRARPKSDLVIRKPRGSSSSQFSDFLPDDRDIRSPTFSTGSASPLPTRPSSAVGIRDACPLLGLNHSSPCLRSKPGSARPQSAHPLSSVPHAGLCRWGADEPSCDDELNSDFFIDNDLDSNMFGSPGENGSRRVRPTSASCVEVRTPTMVSSSGATSIISPKSILGSEGSNELSLLADILMSCRQPPNADECLRSTTWGGKSVRPGRLSELMEMPSALQYALILGHDTCVAALSSRISEWDKTLDLRALGGHGPFQTRDLCGTAFAALHTPKPA